MLHSPRLAVLLPLLLAALVLGAAVVPSFRADAQTCNPAVQECG